MQLPPSANCIAYTHRTTDRVQAMSTRPQDIHRSVTRLHFRLAHTGRRHTNTLVAARLQQQQPLSSTDGAAIRPETVRSLSLLPVPGIAYLFIYLFTYYT